MKIEIIFYLNNRTVLFNPFFEVSGKPITKSVVVIIVFHIYTAASYHFHHPRNKAVTFLF